MESIDKEGSRVMPGAGVAITTALEPRPELKRQANELGEMFGWPVLRRRTTPLPEMFAENEGIDRLLVVQRDRYLLVSKEGWEFFFHPNMAYLRLGNLMRGGRDLLIEATGIGPGDSVLDATLGFGAEAILCAHVVGESGRVDAIEASPEVACVVADGLGRRVTAHAGLNAAMRRVHVLRHGHHTDRMRELPSHSYDVVCFDPFFEVPLSAEESLSSLRAFGQHHALTADAILEAKRLARRRIVVKAPRWSKLFAELGIAERVESRSGKISYGILRMDATN